jgi:hypothetical protein
LLSASVLRALTVAQRASLSVASASCAFFIDVFGLMIAFAYMLITTANLPMPQAHRTPDLAFEFDD